MRFLFFETFEFPEAVISTQLDPTILGDLPIVRRKIVPLTYTMDLHGVSKVLENEVAVTLISNDLVSVSTTTPISIATSDFNLDGGVSKLEEAANVEIVPSATVSFDFLFARVLSSQTADTTQPTLPIENAASTALEPEGNFDKDACEGRFEILSRTDNIYFASGSANIGTRSEPFLNSLIDIIDRCPDLTIEIGGHTDSVGSASANLLLSERRANAVKAHLLEKNVSSTRVQSIGYGESRPTASNTTSEGRRRNRRIEFIVVD